ncbi:MAG: OmpA family protein [Deltaproteobacteria bacterium]|nr:OmpA family protein [Deltaproteobacteria bacterium]MBW2072281.1 OmpA family protein [Deltaproteobacteria bacterium]
MARMRLLFVCPVLVGLLFGCVPKSKYLELEGDVLAQRNQLQREKYKVARLEKSQAQCSEELSALQAKYANLQDRTDELSQELERVKYELAEKESTIEQQARVIKKAFQNRKALEATMKAQIEAKEVKIEELEGKLKVTFVDKILFNTGSVAINQRGKEALLAVSKFLNKEKDQDIVIQGHTDNVPIGPGLRDRYATNWELSAARATAVARFLQDEGGVGPERLAACGYSYYRPVASNDTAEGRHQNRRIEIILTPTRQLQQ